MKVNKSSVECQQYNEKNKDAILAGLLESWIPNDQILEQEKEMTFGEKIAQFEKNLYDKIPPEVRSRFLNPHEKEVKYNWNTRNKILSTIDPSRLNIMVEP